MIIKCNVVNKIARIASGVVGICGNSDYVIRFNFDDEWGSLTTKTARFKWNGQYKDVVFNGTDCNMPVINNTNQVEIGVFAGNLHTSTPAVLEMKKSILCGTGSPAAPSDNVYNQIIALLNGFSASVVKSGNTATITIVDPEGTHMASVSDGEDGEDGHSPVVTATKTGKVTKVSVDGTEIATINDGNDGQDGANGTNGQDGSGTYICTHGNVTTDVQAFTLTSEFFPVPPKKANDLIICINSGYKVFRVTSIGSIAAQVTYIGTINGTNGTNGVDGHTPVKGTDYWTAADKQGIVNDVLDALPTWQGGSY